MEPYVIFKTPGKLDLRSITVFGLNAKPNVDNPIGYFGTGLKYAIATIIRHGFKMTFWINEQKWTIRESDEKFRDKDFKGISLVRHKKLLPDHVKPLPFTTELGRNWGLWQAFRELYSNTLDEKGRVYASSEPYVPEHRGVTAIQVEDPSGDFWDVFNNRDDIILPNAQRSYDEDVDPLVQVLSGESSVLYYRGIRVLTLGKPTQYTYNLLAPVTLTEDRTVSQWDADYLIKQHIASSEDEQLITKAVEAKPRYHEHDLTFDYMYRPPSPTFKTIVRASEHVSAAATRLVDKFEPKVLAPKDSPPDHEFLNWMADRLVEVYKESPQTDFVLRLRKIAAKLKPDEILF